MKQHPNRGFFCFFIVTAIAALVLQVASAWADEAGRSTFGFYPHGFRGRDTQGDIAFAVETPRYAMLINASRFEVTRLGSPEAAEDHVTVARAGEAVAALPANNLKFEIEIDGRVYSPKPGTTKPEDVRLLRMGRWLQHFEIVGLRWVDAEGRELEGVEGAAEFFCWADRAAVRLRLRRETPNASLPSLRIHLDLSSPEDAFTLDSLSENRVWHPSADGLEVAEAVAARRADGSGLAALNPLGEAQALSVTGKVITLARRSAPLEPGGEISASLALAFDRKEIWVGGFAQATEIRYPLGAPQVDAVGLKPYEGPMPVSYDPVAGWTEIALGANPDIRKAESVRLRLTNPYAEPRAFRLNFAKLGGSFGITGMSPVLLDAKGRPSGVTMQISKNWHVSPAWFSGLAVIEVEGGGSREFEFRLAYADWGGAPAVSHAQLCLVGWGVNQQWDQMAIGSFGESICYDPDVNLNRSMIDDMRPLMVWAMGAQPQRQWSWTHNVGGGDFLVAFERGSKRRAYLTGVKTWYRSQGPVMTDVIYSGEALGGAVAATMRARTWRSDDIVRAVYDLEYDFRRNPPPLDRLAFFQLGADNYNENPPSRVYFGAAPGLDREVIQRAGKGEYVARGNEARGAAPWVALAGSAKPGNLKPDDQGAWADRAMIVRDFNLRLDGVEYHDPLFSLYGTDEPQRAAPVVEIGGPVKRGEGEGPSLSQGAIVQPRAGDRVSLRVEMIIYPQRAEDYYGPDEGLRRALETLPRGWGVAWREAALGAPELAVSVGEALEIYPPRVRLKDGRAAFTLKGGLAHVPVTLQGVTPGDDWRVRAWSVGENEPWFEATATDEGAQLICDPEPADARASEGGCELTFTLPLSKSHARRSDTPELGLEPPRETSVEFEITGK